MTGDFVCNVLSRDNSVAVVVVIVMVVGGILEQMVAMCMEITCLCAGWTCCRSCMKLQSLDKKLQSVSDGGDHFLKRFVIARMGHD